MEPSTLRRSAEIVVESRLAGAAFGGFPAGTGPVDEREGYLVAQAARDSLGDRGWGTLAGYKVGCTTRVMQEYLNLSNPAAGGILTGSVHTGSARLRLADYVRPGVECEIAVRLGDDLPAGRAPLRRADVVPAIGACLVALEVVDNRYTDVATLGVPALIADDFFGAGCVLGAETTDIDPYDLAATTAYLEINETIVGHGRGSDILGDPLDALVWLANTVAETGTGLSAGHIVLLGSVVRAHWLDAPSEVVAVNTTLGRVSATFV
jgi:2-keto-4-pentenoate hydratase